MRAESIGIIRANYGHIGDYAIFKGTLNLLGILGVNVTDLIDPDIEFPEEMLSRFNVVRNWPTMLQRNVVSGKGIKKSVYLDAFFAFVSPKVFSVADLDLLWYFGGARFGALCSRYVFAEIVNALYCKRRFKAKMMLGVFQLLLKRALYQNFIQTLYINS